MMERNTLRDLLDAAAETFDAMVLESIYAIVKPDVGKINVESNIRGELAEYEFMHLSFDSSSKMPVFYYKYGQHYIKVFEREQDILVTQIEKLHFKAYEGKTWFKSNYRYYLDILMERSRLASIYALSVPVKSFDGIVSLYTSKDKIRGSALRVRKAIEDLPETCFYKYDVLYKSQDAAKLDYLLKKMTTESLIREMLNVLSDVTFSGETSLAYKALKNTRCFFWIVERYNLVVPNCSNEQEAQMVMEDFKQNYGTLENLMNCPDTKLMYVGTVLCRYNKQYKHGESTSLNSSVSIENYVPFEAVTYSMRKSSETNGKTYAIKDLTFLSASRRHTKDEPDNADN